MSLRTVVLVIFVLSGAYAATFASQISQTFDEIISYVIDVPALLIYMLASAVLLLCGHFMRAYRDTLLFSQAAHTTIRSQFTAFAVGSLCNSILPLRIGEFIRADIIAQKFNISFSFSFVLICTERLVDVLILGVLALALIGFNLPLAVVGCALAALVFALWSPPKIMRKALSSFGGMLNNRIEAKFLFTFWSLEYGLKRTLRIKLMAKYIALSALNWLIYIASMFPAIIFLYGPGEVLRMSVSVFVALTTSLAPGALGDYTSTISGFGFDVSPDLIILWIIAVIPTLLIGLVLTFFNLKHIPLLRKRSGIENGADLENKLSRNSDISTDQLGFMKDYYGGKPLAQKIALEEMAGGSIFARYFTAGGSGALTYQSKINDEICVVKLVSQENSEPLRSQYNWLKKHESPNIVKVLSEEEDENTYSIAIEYEDSAMDFFDFLHTNSLEDGCKAIAEVIQALDENVWRRRGFTLVKPHDARTLMEGYIEKNIWESLNLASEHVPAIGRAMNCSHIIVNGVEYPNIGQMLSRIHEKDIFNDLCQFRVSDSIHGDLICDNLIYAMSKKRPIMIDPVDNKRNLINGPVFDFGKLSQSFQIGYEFLLRDTSPIEVKLLDSTCEIEYVDNRSAIYESLWQYIYNELAPNYLTDEEMRTLLFLGATNYFRRMKYQAIQYPQNAMKIYAVGIRFLCEYIHLFESMDDE